MLRLICQILKDVAGISAVTLFRGMKLGFSAVAIILTGYFSRTYKPLVIVVLQAGFMGLFCMIMSVASENVIIPCEPSTWYTLLALTIICTCFGFAFQPLAQRRCRHESVIIRADEED